MQRAAQVAHSSCAFSRIYPKLQVLWCWRRGNWLFFPLWRRHQEGAGPSGSHSPGAPHDHRSPPCAAEGGEPGSGSRSNVTDRLLHLVRLRIIYFNLRRYKGKYLKGMEPCQYFQFIISKELLLIALFWSGEQSGFKSLKQ